VDSKTPVTCPHCGIGHVGTCPRIKAIEYHENGTVRRIEFKDDVAPYQPARWEPRVPWIISPYGCVATLPDDTQVQNQN